MSFGFDAVYFSVQVPTLSEEFENFIFFVLESGENTFHRNFRACKNGKQFSVVVFSIQFFVETLRKLTREKL
jgi:hypothetical protein